MLRSAFNYLLKINSRPATLKRLGSPDIYSPCLLAHSNYFRFLRGPEHTAIRGREFIIPIDSLYGQHSQEISFDEVPELGDFKLKYGEEETGSISFEEDAEFIQDELRSLEGLSNVLVTGDFEDGFTVVFPGFQSAPDILEVVDNTLEYVDAGNFPVVVDVAAAYYPWTETIRRGDKIVDTVYNTLTVDEIVEMTDVGGSIMGLRIRCE